MIEQVRSRVQSVFRSDFGRNALWFTALSAFERVIAVVQTVLISRALGITEYGVYGLLFGTIGFVASVVGLQMGLTATVFVSKYRIAEKAKAAAVIAIVTRFAWMVAGAFVILTLPFSPTLAEALVGSSHYKFAVVLGILFVASTILSGVQDGIAQGFEVFGALAKLKLAAASFVLASIYPVTSKFGLNGALCAILAGLVLKFVILQRVVVRCRADAQIPRGSGEGISFRALVNGFAVPSMIASLLIGFATWLGMFILSKQQGGFEGIAFVNTGLQWRGPVLMLAASLGGVAVPTFSRMSAKGDASGSRRLRRILTLFNLSAASAVSLTVVAGSGLIMGLYGNGFSEGRLVFSLIVVSTIPTVVANVHLQELVGTARMWQQFWLYCPFLLVMCSCFLYLVPRYSALGYAVSLLSASVVLLATVLGRSLLGGAPQSTAILAPKNSEQI